MGRYLVVRAYSMALTLLLIPGTVVEQMIGADAIVSPEMVAQLRRFFGLDQPWWVQYSRWLGNLAQGDLGTSWRTGKPVVRLILERLPVTIELTLLAVGFALALGIAAGIVSAVRRDRAVDNVVRVGALLGLSVPVFWQGTMLILFFSIYLRWMPPVVWVDLFADPRRNLTIMLLPALCLGTASAANIARTTRACMLDVLRSEYIRTAAAKGLAGRAVEPGEALRAQEMLDLSSGQADRVRAGHDDHTIDDRVAIEDADGRGRGEGARLDRQSRREGHHERGPLERERLDESSFHAVLPRASSSGVSSSSRPSMRSRTRTSRGSNVRPDSSRT